MINKPEDVKVMSCKKCSNQTLMIEVVGYSEPITYSIECTTCGYRFNDDGPPIKVMSLEEHKALRPEFYKNDSET